MNFWRGVWCKSTNRMTENNLTLCFCEATPMCSGQRRSPRLFENALRVVAKSWSRCEVEKVRQKSCDMTEKCILYRKTEVKSSASDSNLAMP
jgi:hypothetical protein